ncbi:MAG: gamma-glutamylcyclotransferase [SAR324 cluster bacterium]|nr:gamma-glutamylcyclotransferase [SAR324 cluster bacterium]
MSKEISAWTDLFVYGTLLPNCRLQNQISGCLRHGPVILERAQLYHLGYFPGIVEEDGFVIGEWISVPPTMLKELDQIEDYDVERDPKDCLYIRKNVQIQRLTDGKSLDVEAYFYNRDSTHLLLNRENLEARFAKNQGDDVTRTERPVQHGCYRRYLGEQDEEGSWLIAFGSNLNQHRLESRVGKVGESRVGWIPNFRLVFNKQSTPSSRETFANIQYQPEFRTPAVASWLDQSQLEQLDEFEGTPDHYLRMVIPFVARDTNHVIEYYQAYVANPNKLGPGNPSESYRNHLEVGYCEYGFGEVPS